MITTGFWTRARQRVVDAVIGALGAPLPKAAELVDVGDVVRTVHRYALAIGCTLSNAAAASSYGLKHGATTLQANRFGKERARALLWRQGNSHGPRSA